MSIHTTTSRQNPVQQGLAVAIALIGLIGAPSAVDAAVHSYSFLNITGNDDNDAQIGEDQMTVEVSDEGLAAGFVKFTFLNSGPEASSITDLYFDDGTLLDISQIYEDGNLTDFEEGATPYLLPGGQDIHWSESGNYFTADSENPRMQNGVNPGEFVTIVFSLQDNQDLADVIAAMELSLRPANVGKDIVGGLRIGIKVQGFDGGGSEGFVNGPGGPVLGPTVPEPTTLTLWGLGLTLCGLARWRSRRSPGITTAA